jgi:hypothetical protein
MNRVDEEAVEQRLSGQHMLFDGQKTIRIVLNLCMQKHWMQNLSGPAVSRELLPIRRLCGCQEVDEELLCAEMVVDPLK